MDLSTVKEFFYAAQNYYQETWFLIDGDKETGISWDFCSIINEFDDKIDELENLMDNISQMCPTGISVEEPYYIRYKGVVYEFDTDTWIWIINNYEKYTKFWDKLIKKTNSTDILTLKEIKDRFYDELDAEDLEFDEDCVGEGYDTDLNKLFNIIMLE
tara:strand:- start:25 stop:498 length:474 start_codon:yes stop_codon:yes gene_type:complete